MLDIISSLILALSGPLLYLRPMNPVTSVSADCLLPLSALISVKMMVLEILIREHPTLLVYGPQNINDHGRLRDNSKHGIRNTVVVLTRITQLVAVSTQALAI